MKTAVTLLAVIVSASAVSTFERSEINTPQTITDIMQLTGGSAQNYFWVFP